jgi:hypothetical protein
MNSDWDGSGLRPCVSRPWISSHSGNFEADIRALVKKRQWGQKNESATAHNQLNLTDDELRFIAKYPDQVRQILTIIP